MSERPQHFEPWEWCVEHSSYRTMRHVKNCKAAWGDPFAVPCLWDWREVPDE